MTPDQWRQAGQTRVINRLHHFYYDSDPGPAGSPARSGQAESAKQKPVLAILHGFPTSSYDYYRVMPELQKHFRVIAADHIGFGFSEKPVNYSYSLLEQAENALQLWQSLGISEVHLLAHDYGTSVATEILARRERFRLPVTIKSVTLCNGSMHIELAKLRILQVLLRNRLLGPLVARISSRLAFKLQMKRIWHDTSAPDLDGELNAMWQCISHDNGRLRMPQIIQYLRERYKYWHRWIGALTRLDIPCHVCWARNDPVAVAAIGQQVADETPTAELTWIEDLGHYPMVEDPQRWLAALFGWYRKQGIVK